MKLLFFTSKPIFPSVDGGCFASEKMLLSLLKAEIDVRYVTLSTNKHPFDEADFTRKMIHKFHPTNFFINTDVRPISAAFHLLKPGSYNADRFYSKDIETKLLELIKSENFDGIVLDSLYSLPYFEAIRSNFSGQIVARTHNVEHQLWEQYAEDARGLKKWYLKRLAKDLKSFEMSALAKVDAILSISKDDTSEFKRLAIQTPISEIPVSIEVAKTPALIAENRIYHLGMMNWEPNRQAVNELVSWMPELRKRLPQLELHIAGSGSKEMVEANEDLGIFVHGFVECADDFARNHGILVSPMRAASGVRIKFLEAMAQGVPIISSQTGALGIDHESSECLIIAHSREEFFERISDLISNPSKGEEIARNALNYIDKNHNIDDISKRIVEVFKRNT